MTAPTQDRTFAEHIRAACDRYGTGTVAQLLGRGPRVIQLWMRGEVPPDRLIQIGALYVLAKHTREEPPTEPDQPNRPVA